MEQSTHPGQASDARQGRPDFLASVGVASGDRDATGTEWRRETKQEREARKLEKERAAREKERVSSMREEHIDGGYLVTQGVYTGTEDYNKCIVRQFMIERRIAPFWRGLNDHQESWTENQLVAAANGLPIPAPDEIPKDYERKAEPVSKTTSTEAHADTDSLTIPISSRAPSFNSETSSNQSSPFQSSFPPATNSSSSIGSALAKGRSKTLASLTSSSKSPQAELKPREIKLPHETNVNGQRLEAHLYKDVSECPICFLYYPPYLNKTRCCDQAMCSECFVQIKRPDPHVPEHADPSVPPPPPQEVEGPEGELVSEPATCPFCKVPDFGITYEPPPFRRGLAYANHPSSHALNPSTSGMSSSSSLASTTSNGGYVSTVNAARRRTISVSANSPTVITADQVRPDWADKLASARAHTARRSAAATALHTAAYLMGNRGHELDLRGFGALGRRGLLRRTSGGDNPSQGTPSSQMSMLALMSERASRIHQAEATSSTNAGSRENSRRGRMEDLEDMMMMEAIRLSLASEEERRKREEKDAKKEAKKKEKENKKAEKAAKKSGVYPSSSNTSTTAFSDPHQSSGKGKSYWSVPSLGESAGDLATPTSDPQSHLERARAQIQNEGSPLPSPNLYNPDPYRPSHLRTQSNVSSSASSMEGGSPPGSLLQDPREPGSSLDGSPAGSRINIPGTGLSQDTFMSGTPPGGGAGTEPMFNFRSLAAMVGDDEKNKEIKHMENISNSQGPIYERGESSATTADQRTNDFRFEFEEAEQPASEVKSEEQHNEMISPPNNAVRS